MPATGTTTTCLTTGSARATSAAFAQAIEPLAAVRVAVDGEQDRRRDLAEPIEDALHAEIRRTRRPDGADRRSAERRNDRLGRVRHDAGDAVAWPDTRRAATRAAARLDGVAQLIPGDRARCRRLSFVAMIAGAVAAPPQHVLA